jgi:hypothetical protein
MLHAAGRCHAAADEKWTSVHHCHEEILILVLDGTHFFISKILKTHLINDLTDILFTIESLKITIKLKNHVGMSPFIHTANN